LTEPKTPDRPPKGEPQQIPEKSAAPESPDCLAGQPPEGTASPIEREVSPAHQAQQDPEQPAAQKLRESLAGQRAEETASPIALDVSPARQQQQDPERAPTPEVPAKLGLGRRIALGMVLLASLSALAAWRASDFDESASQETAVYWQEVNQRAATERLDQEAVNQDVRNFSEYEQDRLLGSSLQQAADQPKQANSAAELLEAQSLDELRQARLALSEFDVSLPVVIANPKRGLASLTYPAAGAYGELLAQDRQNTRLRPDEQRQMALDNEQRSVYLTGIAAIFIAALVLLTIASVSMETTPGKVGSPGQASPGRRVTARGALTASAMLVGTVASVLGIAILAAG
jgi:hypothetical protein